MIRDNTRLLGCCGLLSFVLVSVSAARSQAPPCPEGSRPDCARAIAFFHDLRDLLVRNDQAGIAKMMEYPFLTSLHHKKIHISTPARLLEHFDEVFDEGVRCEIAKATDRDVWGNSRGFAVKDGAIWFDDLIPPGEKADPNSPDFWVKGTFKVITVNNDSYYPCLKSEKSGR
jgi:hypothetical protein